MHLEGLAPGPPGATPPHLGAANGVGRLREERWEQRRQAWPGRFWLWRAGNLLGCPAGT